MNTNVNIKRLPVDMLKLAKYNPRRNLNPGNPAHEKTKTSLKVHGYIAPIIWNEVTDNGMGDHQRYKVLLIAEGATEIDCVVVHIENPQGEKALNKAVEGWEPVLQTF